MRNRFVAVALMVVVAVLVACVPFGTLADFGDFSGGYDYGFSYSSDYSADYSSNYDWDDSSDYGYSYTSYYDGRGSSYDSSADFGDGQWAIIGLIVFFLIFVVLPIRFVKMVFKMSRKASKAIGGARHGFQGRSERPGVQPQQERMLSDLLPVETINQWDPDFSAEEIKQRLSNLYVQMQNCWTAKDITPLRDDFTNAQFTQYDRQLQGYRDRGHTSVVERIAVLGVTLMGVKRDATKDILIADLSTRITAYTIDDETGDIIGGDRNREKFMHYEWTLIRPQGTKTIQQRGMTAFNCPNCGATININQSAKCLYCGSIVTKAEHDWVISGIKGLAQRTM